MPGGMQSQAEKFSLLAQHECFNSVEASAIRMRPNLGYQIALQLASPVDSGSPRPSRMDVRFHRSVDCILPGEGVKTNVRRCSAWTLPAGKDLRQIGISKTLSPRCGGSLRRAMYHLGASTAVTQL